MERERITVDLVVKGMKKYLKEQAKKEGLSFSTYIRNILAKGTKFEEQL